MNRWLVAMIASMLANSYCKAIYAHEKFMQICQNRPLDKFMRFLFMHSSAFCIATYGVIKIYAVQIYATGA